MPTRSSKHGNAQRVFYPSFDGGLNLSVPSESLAKNELKVAENVEFSPKTGSMKVRGGLVWNGEFQYRIADVVPIAGQRGFLIRYANSSIAVYFKWDNAWPLPSGRDYISTGVGYYDRNDPLAYHRMSAVSWVDRVGTGNDAKDEECWLVAGGRLLNKFTCSPVPALDLMQIDTSIQSQTINHTPNPVRMVFLRENRVGVVEGSDRLRFSAIGDCHQWVPYHEGSNTEDETTDGVEIENGAQYVDIGYKDGMDIVAVVPLSKDLIIFKSPPNEPDKGTIWRLTGNFPDWQVVEVAHNTGTFSQWSVCAVGNDIFYATTEGVATLSNVSSYGDVKTGWPDRKINRALVEEIDSTARLYNVPSKQQLWVQPSLNSRKIWVLDYARGIWTTFKFPVDIIYVSSMENQTLLFSSRRVYEVNDNYTVDSITPSGTSVIFAKMMLGTLLSGMQTLIKGAFVSFEMLPGCQAELKLPKWRMPLSYGGELDYIYDPPNDSQFASLDDDPLVPTGGVLTSRRRCIVRDWAITPEIEITGGGCAISTVGFDMVEV